MQAVVLFLNDKPDDPTKRLKLAGVRRYAAAAGWKVVVADVAHSRAEDIPVLLAEFRPAGCICDDDGEPMKVTPGLFGGIPVVFANGHRSRFDSGIGRIGVDNKAVARAAFRELSAGNPSAYAVASFMEPAPFEAARHADVLRLQGRHGHERPFRPRHALAPEGLLPVLRLVEARRPGDAGGVRGPRDGRRPRRRRRTRDGRRPREGGRRSRRRPRRGGPRAGRRRRHPRRALHGGQQRHGDAPHRASRRRRRLLPSPTSPSRRAFRTTRTATAPG